MEGRGEKKIGEKGRGKGHEDDKFHLDTRFSIETNVPASPATGFLSKQLSACFVYSSPGLFCVSAWTPNADVRITSIVSWP